MRAGPRVLVTGFEPFPGAPVNPTEWLVRALNASPPAIEGMGAFRADVLPVDYATVGARLSEIGRAFSPDIAIHFGLAQECRGFRLERLARNSNAVGRVDNSGSLPLAATICVGPETIPSRLALDLLHQALSNDGHPVEWSDDAGGYLCNMVMTLSLAHACEGFTPKVSGFVHVPLTGEGHALSNEQLLRGAVAIIATSVAAYRADAEPMPA